MSQVGQISSDSAGDVEIWDCQKALRSIDLVEAKLSRGFLRCHPEKWFPGFSAHWVPLLNALGSDVRVLEIKPMIASLDSNYNCFKGMLAGESVLLAFDAQGSRVIIEEVVPSLDKSEHSGLVLEYLAQRFFAVLGMCQTGADALAPSFSGPCSASDVPCVGQVKCSFSINSISCVIIVGLGQKLVEKMDGMWRRQMHSATRVSHRSGMLRLEIAQLGVPPQLLSEYLARGAVIDLEVPVSDLITLRIGAKPFMAAKMIEVNGKLACQTVQAAPVNISLPEGTSRLCVEIAAVPVDPPEVVELGQVGGVLVTNVNVGDAVTLTINQEKVADARLCVYQGRFALEVQ